MISIGTFLYGPELQESLISHRLTHASKALIKIRGPLILGEQPVLNVVFVLAGTLGSPSFLGIMYGKYSKKDQALAIQVAVPDTVTRSENPDHFIIDSIRGANAMAFEFFRQKGLHYALSEAEDITSELNQQLTLA